MLSISMLTLCSFVMQCIEIVWFDAAAGNCRYDARQDLNPVAEVEGL